MMSQSAKPEISIIMPCYNAAAYLEAAVASVRSQTFPAWELIVVDDGSTDASPKLLAGISAQDPRIRVLSQANLGPYPARNLGLKHAQGEFIAFLDADDWWEVSFLEKMHRALSASGADLAYCGWQNVGLEGGRGQPYIPPDYQMEDKVECFLRGAAPWPIHAALVRRQVLKEAGGFDLSFPTCMDYDLWLRIAISGTICLVPEVLAYYRHHVSGQITSVQWRQAKNSWLVKRKFIRTHSHLIQHLSAQKIRELVDGSLLQRGYDNFWKRDLISAQKIFRLALLRTWAWGIKDLKYLLPALLPQPWYTSLVTFMDRRQ
jgi:glycosyltransferase involved in cell wall biosynthesis